MCCFLGCATGQVRILGHDQARKGATVDEEDNSNRDKKKDVLERKVRMKVKKKKNNIEMAVQQTSSRLRHSKLKSKCIRYKYICTESVYIRTYRVSPLIADVRISCGFRT